MMRGDICTEYIIMFVNIDIWNQKINFSLSVNFEKQLFTTYEISNVQSKIALKSGTP